MARKHVAIVTAGVMLSLFMASMEATVISTAMPTIVSELGGLDIYSWVFSAYMLASTTTVPIYGKLSDIYGRRPVFGVSMALFLLGSVLAGFAQSMPQLITFRVIQGLGAGGLLPLAFIMVGDLFTFEQRARVQGLFSGVWGVSSVVGPLLGGLLVDSVGWPWVFFINVVPGLAAAALVWAGWHEPTREATGQAIPVDYAGAGLLASAVVLLLVGLFELGTGLSWVLLGVATLLVIALGFTEARASDPILPLQLFRRRLFAIANIHGVMAGAAVFGSASFVPLFVQTVLGTSATVAGATLTPQLIGWVLSSIVGSRLLLRVGYRSLSLIGMILVVGGSLLMAGIDIGTSRVQIMGYLALMGIGMGLSIPAFLLAVQNSVRRRELGTATSTVQFSRSIGGALGVSIMGLILSRGLASGLRAAGVEPGSVALNSLLDPAAHSGVAGAVDELLRSVLAGAIADVFLFAFVASAIGLLVTAFTPAGRIADLDRPGETDRGGTPPMAAGVAGME